MRTSLCFLISIAAGLSQANAQNIAGCSSADVQKLTSAGRQVMGCLHLSFAEIFMFMGSMSSQQRQWLDHCAESTEKYQSDCFKLAESLLEEAATKHGSLPQKILSSIYDNPPQVLNCLGGINNGRDLGPFSPTCTDGVMLAQTLRASARLAPYINTIQPWHFPPAIQGCSMSDLLNVELSFLPFIDCLNVNFTSFLDGFSSSTTYGRQLEDATIRAAIDCLYDPHMKNSECMYLVVLASTKLEGGSWSSLGTYALRALTDYPQACQCVKGIQSLPAFQAVPKTCAAQQTLSLLTSLETSCVFEPQIQSALSQALGGCSDADVVRSELVGLQLMDCMGATGNDVKGTTDAFTSARIAMIAGCFTSPGYSNKDCLALLQSASNIANKEPNSLEAEFMEKMGKDGSAFCECVDAAAKSPPAQSIVPECSIPYKGIQFLRNNQKYCQAIAAVPPSFWSAVASGIASAASSSSSSSSSDTSTVALSDKGEVVEEKSEDVIKFSAGASHQSRHLRQN